MTCTAAVTACSSACARAGLDPDARLRQRISIVLKGGAPAAKKFCESTHLFTLAESLGVVESLANLPALMTHASVPPERRARLGISDALVRLSVGVEDADDL